MVKLLFKIQFKYKLQSTMGETAWSGSWNDNDMLSYSLTTMMCFLTKEWYGFPGYTVNLFIKAYHKITYKEDLKVT